MRTLAEPILTPSARDAQPGEQSDATANPAGNGPRASAGPSPSAVGMREAAEGAAVGDLKGEHDESSFKAMASFCEHAERSAHPNARTAASGVQTGASERRPEREVLCGTGTVQSGSGKTGDRASEAALADLGPLADPTPAERALSLLRSAAAKAGLAWPEHGGKVSLSLVALEEDALRAARNARARGPLEAPATAEVARYDSIADASWRVGFALRMQEPLEGVAKSHNANRKRDAMRFAARAIESLAWVTEKANA